MLKEKIRQLASEFHDEIVAVRRHLHAHPELSYQEEETSRFVAAKLGEWGISHQTGVAGHGIVGEIRGGKGAGRVIALRADMDALPIQEANDVPYRSQNPGVMHACGHDVHTASLLGAARILQSLSAEWSGVVKLLFQPAEERLPGGAKLMIEAGVLENPVPELIIGQHVHPPLAAGRVGLRPGRYMASADELYLTVKGRGGHGALPHDCVDPILVASHLIVALQQLVSRRSDPTIPSVLTIGKIESEGGSTNVIPNAVHMMGTFRTMDEQWRAEAHELMERLVDGLVRSMGA
ncbi:MAG: amidohydrolase, partial [Saprospiraceae bacterium]|nr:amidohydrolase [Saprospiraceae bacterium]